MTALNCSRAPDELDYQTDAWWIGEDSLIQACLPQSQAVFSVGNGFIGIRGCFDESPDGCALRSGAPVYLNGVYERCPIRYHESAYGFPAASDSRIAVPDGTELEIVVADERVSPSHGEVLDYTRRLDLRRGVLTRRMRLRLPSGRIVETTFERFACFSHPLLAALRVTVLPVNFSARITIVSALRKIKSDTEKPSPEAGDSYDPRLGPGFDHDPWADQERIHDDDAQGFIQVTPNSAIQVASLMAHQWTGEPHTRLVGGEQSIARHLSFDGRQGESIALIKYLAYAASGRRRRETPARAGALAALELARGRGFEALLGEQGKYLDHFWDQSSIEFDGAPALQCAVRFGMFQLLQAAGRDGETSISANGQTGEGYEGHVFWDAESFVLPLFAFTVPEIARSMLIYRHARLEQARRIAITMGHRRGALFPWRTIDGQECSSFFPAGSAQYHINADIADAIALYYRATLDHEFLARYGAEMLVETARLWLEVGFFNPRLDGQFCIDRVTGPDEYSALVDNNFYTNAMARENLQSALRALDDLGTHLPDERARLIATLAVTDAEIQGWREAAARMYLPYCQRAEIYLQDDAFLDKKVWDIANTPAEKFPLLKHFHPLTIYRHQVCKQGDVVLAMSVLGHLFDPEAMARTYKYYRGVTVHDSSLSAGTFSIVASRLGRREEALDYFKRTVWVDLHNLGKNTDHGLHMAGMGNAWMAVVRGFGGMHTANATLSFDPTFNEGIGPYRFRVRFQDRRIEVDVDRERVEYRLLEGASIDMIHREQCFHLESATQFSLDA